MKRALKIALKIFLILAITIVTFAVTFGTYLFWTPDFHVTTEVAARLVEKYAPENLKIGFSSFTLEINRPRGEFWSKQIVLEAKDLCVQLDKTAVDTCIGDVRLAFTGGWSGQVAANESRIFPHIENIEPLRVVGAVIHIDLTAFPKSEDETPSKFDFFAFLRKEILPKWDLEGSRVNVTDFVIKTAPASTFAAKFDLQPGEGSQDLAAVLHEVRQLDGPLRASAFVNITRPQDWGADPVEKTETGKDVHVAKHSWKINAGGTLDLNPSEAINLLIDAKIRDMQKFDFAIQTLIRGIPAVREARFDGSVRADDFKGEISVKGGSPEANLQALNFVNCAVSANLDKKTGGIHCGPQQVHLKVREQGLVHRPDLFIFDPELDLKVNNLKFGDVKSLDYTFSLVMDHMGITRIGTRLAGHVEIGKKALWSVKGRADAVVPAFMQITKILNKTPYSIPAPLNTLDGALGVQANVDLSQDGGSVKYLASTRLDSEFQKVHLDIDGATRLQKVEGGALAPFTDVTVLIEALALSAPRFELRAPPALKPDARFGRIDRRVVKTKLAAPAKPGPGRFHLHIRTTSRQAIQIATNLTKSPIPITVDAVYDDHSTERSPVTGYVEVGTVPVELFKRNATVQNIRVDLLGSGDDRLNGLIAINYGDYAISILLLGQVADPQVRFVSDPPLDDNEIVSVLLFGRPQHELGDDERNSAANTQAAMANAVLGLGSLYFLASTPVESVGYDPDTGRVIARVGLGGGASIELGAGDQDAGSGVGFRKRLSKDFTFRSEVATLGNTGGQTVLALIEWVRRF